VSDDGNISIVKLPLDHEARFPEGCVVCGREEPASKVTLWTSTSWSGFLKRLDARRTEVPACPRCAWRIRLGRLARAALFVIALIVCGIAATFMAPGAPPIVPAAIMILFVPPLIVISTFVTGISSRAIAIYVRRTCVDYHFARRGYAEEFAQLNGSKAQHVMDRPMPPGRGSLW
jgi:hypothetical protein